MKNLTKSEMEAQAIAFFNMSPDAMQKLIEGYIAEQPVLIRAAYNFSEEYSSAQEAGKDYDFNDDEVQFATDMLVFLVYALLPKEKKVKKITEKMLENYQVGAMEMVKSLGDDSGLSEKEQDQKIENYAQSTLLRFLFAEICGAYEEEKIREELFDELLFYAFLIMDCLTGELA